jgi:NAD(P)-dependent dehydrogenase (short-subunit alcohol dehydrogenase family)
MTAGFEGKAVLLTGGSTGIGRATAIRLLDAGARVLIADVNVDGAKAVADTNDRAAAIRCDVSDPDDVAAAVETAVKLFGGLDVLINNAGIPSAGGLIVDGSPEDLQRTLAVNITGPYYGIKYGAPRIAERGGGAIVTTASTAGLNGMPAMAAYAASKAAVINLTKSAALELRPLKVRVNCVLPGIIETPMLDGIKAIYEAVSPVPIADLVAAKQGRMGDPDDIARALVYLASDAAEFVSGVALTVDNAMSASLF